MAGSTGTSRMAGRIGSLLVLAGLLLFFLGLFGAPRGLTFVGVGLMILALVAYTIEEYSIRARELS
jgi:hypothetical protein